MNCWHSKAELIWANDFDIDDENDDFCI